MYSTGVLSFAVFFPLLISSQTTIDRKLEGPFPKYACEDQIANLVCSLNRTIEIDSLFYGREPLKDHICQGDSPQGTCKMIGFDEEEKLNNLKKACNGKTHCNIFASDLTFGDRQKCPNITKYLLIMYKCPLPPLPSTREPSTKEPIYYTGTSRPGTSTKPTAEPYIELHKLDEDGKQWPTPRPRVECNTTAEPPEEVDLSSAASSLKPCLPLILAIFIWKLFP